MNKVIWKYEIGDGVTELNMPATAQVLTFRAQYDKMYIWALVDREEKEKTRSFAVYETGEELMDDTKFQSVYIGTIMRGVFVWHCFEIIDKR